MITVSNTRNTALDWQAAQKRTDRLLFIAICCTAVFVTPLVVLADINLGLSLLLSVAAVIGIAALVIRWPQAGFFVIAGCIVFIDQAPLLVPVITDRVYVYYWPPALEGLVERPIGFLFLFVLFVVICRNVVTRAPLLKGGPLIVPFLLFLLCLATGAVYGYLTGGQLKIIVVELRPFVYLFESYLVAYNLASRKRYVYGFFWLVIAGAGVKALQGIYIYIKLHGQLGDVSLMSHEESFFFVGLLLLVILLSLHHHYRPQLIAALTVLPFVVVALVLNNRRADYVALLLGLGVAWLLIFAIRPQARKMLLIVLFLTLFFGGGYVASFANSTSGIGLPAHAIVSIFNPDSTDARNADSNQYRVIENYDLIYTVEHNNLLFGLGFGKPYLQPVPLTTLFPQIGSIDIYYNYVPHNNIYWILMRLGVTGFLLFWFLIGSILVRGSLIALRLRDPYLQLVAIYAVSMTVMEIVVAYADYQLFAYRNVIYIGLLAGILMRLPALDKGKLPALDQEDMKDEKIKPSIPGEKDRKRIATTL